MITNPEGIPEALMEDISLVCVAIGPMLIGDEFPKNEDGSYKTELTMAECDASFEAITRKYWRDQIAGYRAREAKKAAMEATAATPKDPFATEEEQATPAEEQATPSS